MISRRHRVWIASLIIVPLILTCGIWLLRTQPEPVSQPQRADKQPAATAAPPPVPALSNSPFLNAKPEVQFVGSDQCVDCHAEAHVSYLQTTHSRAFGPVSIDDSHSEFSFRHEKSRRILRVYQKNGELHHQELLMADAAGEEMPLADFAVQYTVGSGNNAHTYLTEIDGFLFESPITWYAKQNSWDLSPGYDRINHVSFSRLVDAECLRCHTGRVESVSANDGRMLIHEMQIGCEKCHGPGSKHVALRSGLEADADGIDHTIVNPRHLSRELSEAICAQCHLAGASHAYVRGKDASDFRPGLPLSDFRIDYREDNPDAPMTVAGHFQQMYASKCYTKSTTLSCTTCHPPHRQLQPGNKVQHFRAICMSCHAGDKGCQFPEPQRLAKSPMDNCITCHMQQTEIRVPHLAFTHHRIGNHEAVRTPPPTRDARPLVPIGKQNERLSDLDRKRCLAIASLNYADSVSGPQSAAYRLRARVLLESLYSSGMRDAEVTASLAWLYWEEQQSSRFVELAGEALKDKNCSTTSRANSLFLLAINNLENNELKLAEQKLTKILDLKPGHSYYNLLAQCRLRAGDARGAIAWFEKSIELLPQQPNIHLALAELYDKFRKPNETARHKELAERFDRMFKSARRTP